MKQTLKRLATLCLLFTLINISFSVASTNSIDTLAIQKNTKKVPGGYNKSAELLALYLCKEYNDDASKVYAMSYWLATNVGYDYKGFTKHRAITYDSDMVLKKRKALCGEYANTFKEMCGFAGLKAETVIGYTKDIDFMPNDTLFRSEHAWSAVKIDNKWTLLDITWASGYAKPNAQILQKMGTMLFHIPYKTTYSYKQRFNSEWIFTSPAKMIYTHFPTPKMFQLLENPVPIDSFRADSKAIERCLAANSNTVTTSTDIDNFSEKSATDKWIFVGNEGLKENKFDSRLKGFAYLYAIENTYQQQYDAGKRTFNLDKTQLKKLKKIVFSSDSLLKQSVKDNDLEYQQLQKRSEYWKASLKTNNKLHITNLKDRIKVNNADLKTIKKINQKSVAMTSFLSSRTDQYRYRTLDGVSRAKTADPLADNESKVLMHQQDSLRKLALGSLFNIETINRVYSQEKVTDIASTETKALNIYDANLKIIQENARKNRLSLQLVHNPPMLVEKHWMRREHFSADSINKANIDPMLNNLYENELKFYDLTKQYTGFVKDRLTLLKAAKKKSASKQNEDSLFTQAVTNYTDNMLSYHFELKTYMVAKDQLNSNLKAENNKMKELSKNLQKESDIENFRHKVYLERRMIIKKGESDKAKLAIKRLNTINTLIDRSLLTAK